MDESDIYNVEKYTERELFEILDINNPSDRELEISIMKNVRYYEKDKDYNVKSSMLYRFFNDMYRRFFDVSDDEGVESAEGFVNASGEFYGTNVDAQGKLTSGKDASIINKKTGALNLAINSFQKLIDMGIDLSNVSNEKTNELVTQVIDAEINKMTPEQQLALLEQINKMTLGERLEFFSGLKHIFYEELIRITKSIVDNVRGNIDMIKGNIDAKQINTHNLDYIKDNLNPIKRETMFKMISIDSQFRDDARVTSATNFTMNLSSSIENVISIKLYSIQIPYTWYMVNDGFGSNFFYIKGQSPGINNGNHDVKVAIDSGNYTQNELISAINDRFLHLSTNDIYALDVSFGNTKSFYNATNAKVRFDIDMKKTFTESDYKLYFPNWTSPNVEGDAKNDSLASFLGYNFETYYPTTARGNLYSFYGNASIFDSTNANYILLEGINDSFSVIQYEGPNAYVPNVSDKLQQIDINFNGLSFGTTYSRNQLYENIKTQIDTSDFFDHEYTDISFAIVTNELYAWDGYNHYELSVKLNRKKTVNLKNTKIAIIFPQEVEMSGFNSSNFIWTGANSCFRFDNSFNEISEIISETETLLTNYIVGNADIIKFVSTKPLFNVPENEYIAAIEQSTIDGYLLSNYSDKINQSLIAMNTNTVTPTKPNGIFNINILNGLNIRNTNFSIFNSKATFQLDILKTFDQTSYIIDLGNCFLSKDPFFFSNTISNLTETSYTIANTFAVSSTYSISTTDQIVLYPKTSGGLYGNGYGNQNQTTLTIPLNPSNAFDGGSLEELSVHMNNVFSNVVDSETGENILSNTKFLFKTNVINTNNVDVSLNFIISKNLTETDYEVQFNTNSIDSINPWKKLYLQSSYELSSYLVGNYAIVAGNTQVFQNTIEVRENFNIFQIIPYYDGVYDTTGANDITITIPTSSVKGSNYTRDELIVEINARLAANELTKNSTMTLFNIGQNQYSKLRINIDKTYLSKDFKLVFYDPISFSYCGVGTSGGRSIRTATWDSTLGWLMGFHSYTEYSLGDFLKITDASLQDENYRYNLFEQDGTNSYVHSYQASTGKISVISDSILNTNLYNYFLIVLDDYIQNHVNDGLVTITSLEKDVALPTYASRVSYQCDPVSGKKIAVSASNKENMNLTSRQLYAMNQVIEARRTKEKSYSTGPVMRDVFALVPLKLSGLQFGSTYMEFGGTLQNQDRKYFGPVRIQKFSVKLMNDKGDVVNLNGGNWSFTIICEIMVGK